ncbi:Abhydrolase domain-containing protein 1 [Wickerhamomyces ciferrii]|uniref:Abhydrolase domain-containing protein 1 n=1 Tax=Wickerhamomyces ciferrii (strain ATCC 14091 / BCRC 22168 / CBS 111 / JCM 3599 / NBRC 0793 / NRRL Y-1031 F-60-10) TaxID=1206466 RepID=K0KZW9_WICCF|nr:Abhydrolase domain-containing protein 1 [Wickerhamomyces ciferrii]CCH46693.1 Abhydrolase domain-containing protein 1 [Wickerhamomyces ciferrii]
MVGFIGNVESFQADNTVKLHLKNGGEDGTSIIPFKEVVNSVDGLSNGSKFWLKPWLFTGDLQTMYLGAADYSREFQVWYGRRLIEFPDGGSSTADFAIPKPESTEDFYNIAAKTLPSGWPKQHPRTRFFTPEELSQQPSNDTKPLVIISHGLGSGSHAPEVRSIVDKLTNINGFEVVVLNSRGCSRSKLTSGELFNGLATDDLRHFVKFIQNIYPNRPLFGIGLSFGSTVLVNYLGEEGDQSPFVASVTLSNPWDMVDSMYRFPNRFLTRFLFQDVTTSYLTRLLKSNRETLLKEGLITEKDLKHKYTSISDFDNRITAPLYGFPTSWTYYRAASSINRIFNVQTPLLSINSFDDPVVGVHSIPTEEAKHNPYIVQLRTDLGGHLGYIQSDGDSWASKKICEFFKNFNDLVDTTKKPETDYIKPVSRYDSKLHY